MSRKWVSGLRKGQPYYLNLDTNEETFIKPRDFDGDDEADPTGECSVNASRMAKEQLDSGIITKEEYNVIISKIEKGQEVDDIDQFLNDVPSRQRFHSVDSLPDEVTDDPNLVITDLTTGKKVHIAVASDALPVQNYDTFESLYVIDKDTGRKTFLSDVQIEQFDTFAETQKRLGKRRGAAKLHRQAKEFRDSAPAALRVKLFNALKDLNQRLQTPSGQRILVGESPYFGGSLIKTRAAMVMAVQIKLKTAWMNAVNSGAVTSDIPASKGDMMTLPEFVEVLQLMGFNATLESAAQVVDRWGKADEKGRIHFREFLKWCDLDSCFVKSSDLVKTTASSSGPADLSEEEFNAGLEDEVISETLQDPVTNREQELRQELAQAREHLASGRLTSAEADAWRSRVEDLKAELAALTGNWASDEEEPGVDGSSEAAQLVAELVNTIEVGADERPDSDVDEGQVTSDNVVHSADARAAVAEAISVGTEAARRDGSEPRPGAGTPGSRKIHQIMSEREEDDTEAQRKARGRVQQAMSITESTESPRDSRGRKKSKKKKKKKKKKEQTKTRIKTINLKPVDVVKVLYNFEASDESELSMKVGQILTIYKQDASGWWYAKNDDDEEGFVPHNYVKSVKDQPDIVAGATQ